MEKCLVMFTKTFPYETGESFIENEIEIASQYYDEIIIVACQVSDFKNNIRKVPNNVKVIPLKATSLKKNIVKAPINIIKGAFEKEFRNEWKNTENLKQKLFFLYYYCKVVEMEKQCNELICNILACERWYTYYSYWFFDIPYLIIRLMHKINKKKPIFISRAHGYDLYEYRNSFNYFPFRKLIFETIDCVYVCSNDGKKYLQSKYPKYVSKIKKSYLGTYDEGINFSDNPQEFVIATCSSLIPLKRVGRLAEALCDLEKEVNKNIRWICIGDGPEKSRIVEFCRNNLTKGMVDFKGQKSNQEVLNIYKNSAISIFVNLSTTEGLPVSIMEAMSFGIPVIATDVGGSKELIESNELGVLLSKDFTNEELIKSIKRFISMDENEMAIMRKKIRDFWLENFDAEANYKKFYEKLTILEKEE